MTASCPQSLVGNAGQPGALLLGEDYRKDGTQALLPSGPGGRDPEMKAVLIKMLSQCPSPSTLPPSPGHHGGPLPTRVEALYLGSDKPGSSTY